MNYVHVEFERVAKITERAILFIVEGENLWIPKRCIAPADVDQYEENDLDGSVSVSDWFAHKEGLA